MPRKLKKIETKIIHAGEPDPPISGAVSMPIFQSSTYVYEDEKSYHDVRYIRLNNTPNHHVLHAKLAALENAEAALVASSGMAAITASLLTVLSAGDHLLVQNCVYGGTHTFLTHDFESMGLSYDFVDAADPESWKSKLKPTTRAFYVETMTNPTLQMAALESVVEFARENKLVSMIDNTFASPVNFRPPEHGFDLSLHSATKYLNGHTDIVAGAVIGRGDLIEKIKHKLNHLGGALDPHACFLLHRGIKTLALRVRFQNQSALKIAEFLEGNDAVTVVNYPGLKSHPQHKQAKALFDGYGGMLSFDLNGGADMAERFFRNTSIPFVAPSLGGVETLITRPATTSHAGLSAEERAALGITDSLVRVSVGIENTDDLIADFEKALKV